LEVPLGARYGAQTQRAINNFALSGLTMPEPFIRALLLIKRAAAQTNADLGMLDQATAQAIVTAIDDLLADNPIQHFPVDVFQTGSGTSTNMNANEVIANTAASASGLRVDPNDHVNMSQSSNDTIPSAIHLSAALEINNQLIPALATLLHELKARSAGLGDKVKTGRTHLMDAMPLTLEQELSGWAAQISSGIARVHSVLPRLHCLAQGGTAVGTGTNAPAGFAGKIAQHLSQFTGLGLQPADNFFEAIASQDTAVELSGALKTLSVSLMKIANDLRWMNSGPLAGLGEIELKTLLPGSSIMPGKVNPVLPEAVMMICAQVIGNDTTITVAGQAGNFQLNVMLPVLAYNLLQSIHLLANASHALQEVIGTFTVNDAGLEAALVRNPILITALNPVIGYAKAAAIAKRAYAEKRPIIDVALEMTDMDADTLRRLLDPQLLTRGGVNDI
ncbi:MAG: class II fumarate hydratase, partial [Proteobacteria bacterium]|nr:class II fumarate hydratase [Pseudomonadota bacterium]